MYLPDDNEGKGAAVVCQAHRVSRHSLNTQSWQTETGKAESCTWVVCKKLHCLTHTWVHGGHRTEWLGWAKEVLKKHGSKKKHWFYITEHETCPYLQTNVNPTDLSDHGL